MSYITTMIVSDGIVMAADSACSMLRVVDTKNIHNNNYDNAIQNITGDQMAIDYQNVIGSYIISKSVQKLWEMKKCPIAISSGQETITRNTGKSIQPYINFFCNNNCYDNPKDAALDLLQLIRSVDPTIGAIFHVCGYNPSSSIPYPEFWVVDIAKGMLTCALKQGQGGFNYHGANDFFTPYALMISQNLIYFTLQDAIDITLLAFNMSIKLQKFIKLEQYIAPPIDLLVITPSGIKWIQKKELRGE